MFTLEQMAAHFMAASERCDAELAGVVGTVVMRAAVLSRDYIGHQQDIWAPLSTATVEGFRHINGRWIPGKRELGYGGAESPLLREGDLRDSIDIDVTALVGVVGSGSKIGLYQELGTPNAEYPIPSSPPRSFLAKGLQASVASSLEELTEVVVTSLLVPIP